MQPFPVRYKIAFLLAGKTQIVFETLDVMRLWQNTVTDITTYHYNGFVTYLSARYKLQQSTVKVKPKLKGPIVTDKRWSGHGKIIQ